MDESESKTMINSDTRLKSNRKSDVSQDLNKDLRPDETTGLMRFPSIEKLGKTYNNISKTNIFIHSDQTNSMLKKRAMMNMTQRKKAQMIFDRLEACMHTQMMGGATLDKFRQKQNNTINKIHSINRKYPMSPSQVLNSKQALAHQQSRALNSTTLSPSTMPVSPLNLQSPMAITTVTLSPQQRKGPTPFHQAYNIMNQNAIHRPSLSNISSTESRSTT